MLCRATRCWWSIRRCRRKNVQELIALAKSKPGTLNYGSYGIGTYAHLSMEDFKQRTGTDIVHIPYRGAAPAATGLLGGDVSMLLLNLSQHRGAMRRPARCSILAAATEKRAGDTARPADHRRGRRAGLPDLGLVRAVRPRRTCRRSWWRRSMPTSRKVLDLPQTREFFETNSFERVDLSPAAFGQLIESDFEALGSADQGGRRQVRLNLRRRPRGRKP